MFCTEKLKLYTGAKIVTLYDPMPIVEAVCVIGERIHAMGSLVTHTFIIGRYLTFWNGSAEPGKQ